jgi:hypothetical protein
VFLQGFRCYSPPFVVVSPLGGRLTAVSYVLLSRFRAANCSASASLPNRRLNVGISLLRDDLALASHDRILPSLTVRLV